MNSQQSRPGSSGSTSGQSHSSSQDVGAKAGEAGSKVADAALEASGQAPRAASSLASDTTKHAKGFLNMQVGAGAEMVDHVVQSARAAAESLDQNAPQLAGLVRNTADRVEHFSQDLRDQTVDDLIKKSSNFTRKHPALVFGLASLAGFLAFRVLKSSAPEFSSEPERSWEHEPVAERFEGGAGHTTGY